MKIKFKKLKKEAILPRYAQPGDAGFDLFSCEDYFLKPGERHLFNIGLASEISDGYFVMFKPKSGLAVKAGIDLLAGVIDSGYRGEWGIVLINLGQESYQFKVGDKVCQAILFKAEKVQVVQADRLSQTVRGQGGFGSSGR